MALLPALRSAASTAGESFSSSGVSFQTGMEGGNPRVK
jgi:hypothetical protein